jgi:hypothetical protein
MDKQTYIYEGPVFVFGKMVSSKWTGKTIAASPESALSHLKYQYKRSHNLTVNAKIDMKKEKVIAI